MDLLRATAIEKAYGDRLILKGADLLVAEGDRVGLVGPNGCGKTTFLRILAGLEPQDHGQIVRKPLGVLEQEPVLPGTTVGDAMDDALAWHRDLLAAWNAATEAHDDVTAARLHGQLDLHGWDVAHRGEAMLDRLRAPGRDRRVADLSGGEKRRVALARALVASPDLLLLDEPTNHLDGDVCEWLQDFLSGFRGGLVLVTHDRYLLEAVATRIVEVEDGVCVPYEGSYTDYLLARAERQAALTKDRDARLNLLAREAAWAARSPAARSVKQKARLQRLDALKDSIPSLRTQTFSLDLRTGDKLGRTLLELRGVTKSLGGRLLISGLDLDLGPGDRLAVVGANGAGKSTLLKMVLDRLSPDKGTITRGPRVKIAVLDQERSGLPENDTVFEAAGGGNSHVVLNDQPVHVAGFLERFLFTRQHFDQKVHGLSGGERARLLLARLLLQGANLLLLDEPTNDLDLTTLAVLEEALLAYDGAVLVVTHDRAFVDRACNGVLAFEEAGKIVRYASRQQVLAARAAALAAPPPKSTAPPPVAEKRARKGLSFKEQRELEGLPAQIEALEAEQAAIEGRLADPAVWKTADGRTLSARVEALPAEVAAAYARWEELESRRS